MKSGKRLSSVAALLLLLSLPATTRGDTFVFSNPTPIAGPDGSALLPYPSPIVVSGLAGSVSKATVTLTGVSHDVPDDIDALLVGPGGAGVMLLSDACGGSPGIGGITLTFDDAAATTPPNGPPSCVSGTFRPVNHAGTDGAESLPPPAPPSPYGTALSVFNGAGPNGNWSLHVRDDSANAASGAGITGGWSLTLSGPIPAVDCGGGVATLLGTPGPDLLTGTPGADVIAGLGGRDAIRGLAGNDVLCGGAGRDRLHGGAGRDRLLGGSGKDRLGGGKGRDALKGGPGKDKEVQ